MALVLKDVAGNVWSITSSPDGAPQMDPGGDNAGPVILRPFREDTHVAWELKVENIDGQDSLTATPVPWQENLPQAATCRDTSAAWYFIGITADGTVMSMLTWPAGRVYQVGELYAGNGAYPPPQQPGGIGAPVTMPHQEVDELRGKWMAGCGHSFNSYATFMADIDGRGPTAIICCPVCLFVERQIFPYDLIHQDGYMALFM